VTKAHVFVKAGGGMASYGAISGGNGVMASSLRRKISGISSGAARNNQA